MLTHPFPVNTPTFNHQDSSGNNADTITRTITVTDTTKPVITLSGDSSITHEAGTNYTDSGATWTDLVDGSGSVTPTGNVNASIPGEYTLTFNHQDSSGNNADTITRTITVVDTTKPVITLSGDGSVTHEAGTDYIDSGATWADLVDGSGTISGTGDVNSSKPGTYTMVFNYVDAAGNSANTVIRSVIVVDTTKPVISLNGDSTINLEAGSSYEDAGATWSDLVDGTGTISGTGDVNVSKPGTYTVEFDYVDAAGNQADTIIRSITVIDTTNPVISLIGNSNIVHEAGTSYEDAGARWTDQVDGTGNITGTGNVDISSLGVYIIL